MKSAEEFRPGNFPDIGEHSYDGGDYSDLHYDCDNPSDEHEFHDHFNYSDSSCSEDDIPEDAGYTYPEDYCPSDFDDRPITDARYIDYDDITYESPWDDNPGFDDEEYY